MTSQAERAQTGGLNAAKWAVAIILLIGATLGNRYVPDVLPQMPAWLRITLLGIIALGALALTFTTAQGKSFVKLLKEAQIEGRRVVWPTKEETWQTTLIVLAVVLVMSLILWGLDSLFGWMISAAIG